MELSTKKRKAQELKKLIKELMPTVIIDDKVFTVIDDKNVSIDSDDFEIEIKI